MCIGWERESVWTWQNVNWWIWLIEGLSFYLFNFSMGLKFFKIHLGANNLLPGKLRFAFRNVILGWSMQPKNWVWGGGFFCFFKEDKYVNPGTKGSHLLPHARKNRENSPDGETEETDVQNDTEKSDQATPKTERLMRASPCFWSFSSWSQSKKPAACLPLGSRTHSYISCPPFAETNLSEFFCYLQPSGGGRGGGYVVRRRW